MGTATKSFWRHIGIVVFLIMIAISCRIMAWNTNELFFDKWLVFIRVSIYIGIFFFWGISVSRRIMQRQVRQTLIVITVLIIGWQFLKEWKFHYMVNPHWIRYSWYIYYIPLLLVPLLALMVSISLGKSENYRLPKWTAIFYLPTALLAVLILTNDWHQFAFIFPKNAAVWGESAYSYGWLYYAVVGWMLCCSVASLLVMATKLRVSHSKRVTWLPLWPFVIAAVYMVLYITRVPFFLSIFGDLSTVFCVIFVGYFESCIQSGLIPSNSRYSDLFHASTNLSAQIVDKKYVPRIKAKDALALSEGDMRRANKAPFVIDDKRILYNMPVDGGYVIWTKDVSELLNVRESLEIHKEELSERNALLKIEYEKEKKHQMVTEQNRLYDLLQSMTQAQLDKIHELTQQYRQTDNEEQRKQILARIIVLGTFIKRRKDFILSQDGQEQITQEMLKNAFEESFHALRLLQIKGNYWVDCKDIKLQEKLVTAYDFFETVMETVLDRVHTLNVRVCRVKGILRISILADASVDKTQLQILYPDTIFEIYESETSFILPLEGGAIA